MEDIENPLGGPNLVPNGPPSPSAHASQSVLSQKNGESPSYEDVEVEMMDQDEFEFLDGVTQLGSLRSGKL